MKRTNPPEIRPLSGDKKEKYKNDCRGYYDKGTIYLNSKHERLTVKTVDHEYMHHILTKLEGEETSEAFDNEDFGQYFCHFLHPDKCTCLYCEHYVPDSLTIDVGWCRGSIKVWSTDTCEHSETSPILESLPFSDYSTWESYRRFPLVKEIYKLVESDSERVRERYLKVLENVADFYKEIADADDQFRLDCRKLGGECDPDYCKEDCSSFEKGTPKIFRYLEGRAESP